MEEVGYLWCFSLYGFFHSHCVFYFFLFFCDCGDEVSTMRFLLWSQTWVFSPCTWMVGLFVEILCWGYMFVQITLGRCAKGGPEFGDLFYNTCASFTQFKYYPLLLLPQFQWCVLQGHISMSYIIWMHKCSMTFSLGIESRFNM